MKEQRFEKRKGIMQRKGRAVCRACLRGRARESAVADRGRCLVGQSGGNAAKK